MSTNQQVSFKTDITADAFFKKKIVIADAIRTYLKK